MQVEASSTLPESGHIWGVNLGSLHISEFFLTNIFYILYRRYRFPTPSIQTSTSPSHDTGLVAQDVDKSAMDSEARAFFWWS